jgi:hypothetical protein
VQLINDDLFKEELVRLKEEILEEIDYVYFSQPPVSEETDTKNKIPARVLGPVTY